MSGQKIMQSVQWHLGLFGAYLVQYAKVRLGYRADFFIGLATSLAATVFAFGFLFVLFTKIPRLAGWRFEEIVFLYGFALVPFGLFNVISLNIYEFSSEYIVEGKFDRVLLRPVGTLFQVIFEAFRIESLHEVLTGLVAMAWAAQRLGLEWTAGDAALLAVFAFSGAVIYASVFVMLTSASFWFEDRIGIIPPVWNLIAFGRYPLSIYSPFIRFVLSWVIPFGFASFYPTVRLLGRSEFRELAPLGPVVAAAFLALALFVWNRGVRQYSSTGS